MSPLSTRLPPPRGRPPWWAVVCGVGALAVAVRLLVATHGWGIGRDGVDFLDVARSIRDGTYFQAWTLRMLHPVYPAACALLALATGNLEWGGRVVSILSGGATAVLGAAWWARTRGRFEGGLVGIFLATQPGLVLRGGEVYAESLMTLLWLPLLATLARDRARDHADHRRAALAGLLLGLQSLVKNTTIFYVPGVVLVWLWPLVRARQFRLASRSAAALLLTFGVVFSLPFVHLEVAGPGIRHVAQSLGQGGTSMLVQHLDVPAVEAEAIVSDPIRRALYLARRVVEFEVSGPLYPWYLVLPLALIGVRSILERRDRATSAWCIATGMCASHIVALVLGTHVESRFLLAGVLVGLPAVAAGIGVVWRATVGSGSLRCGAAGLLVAIVGLWAHSFGGVVQVQGEIRNPYYFASRALTESGEPMPTRCLAADGQICVRADADWIELNTGDGPAWASIFRSRGCDALIVGPLEATRAPQLAEALDLHVGEVWSGLRVVVATGRVTILRGPR